MNTKLFPILCSSMWLLAACGADLDTDTLSSGALDPVTIAKGGPTGTGGGGGTDDPCTSAFDELLKVDPYAGENGKTRTFDLGERCIKELDKERKFCGRTLQK